MKIVRYGAAIATIVMSLLNLGVALPGNGGDIPAPLTWLISLLGVVGIVTAIALLRSAAWATPALVAVGALNLLGAVIGFIENWDGAIIGFSLSAIGTALAVAYALGRVTKAPVAS